MNQPLRLAVVGVGRIGIFHARHVQELARERGACELVALVDGYRDTARRAAARLQPNQPGEIRSFETVNDLLAAGVANAAVVASRTEDHAAHTRALIDAGCRVLMEKPLTHTLASAEEFVSDLSTDPTKQRALMQAFMRRYDAPLLLARSLLERGLIGTPFKAVSVLEDPLPPPTGYQSPGILPDMAVHNIDEVLWLLGQKPQAVSALGASLYNVKISPVQEDFDDAFLQLWFPDNLVGQIQVSRNHVAGYRNETWIYGDRGHIHVGPFRGDPLRVAVAAYGPTGPLEDTTIALRDYGPGVPVFIQRFGPAYKAEVADFVERCLRDEPFSVTQEDGLAAMQVAAAGARALATQADAVPVEYIRR